MNYQLAPQYKPNNFSDIPQQGFEKKLVVNNPIFSKPLQRIVTQGPDELIENSEGNAQVKVEAFNQKTEKPIGQVAAVAVENSKVLENCEQNPDVCNKTKPEKPIILTPTPTPSPTPTIVIPVIIDPKPTIPVEPTIPPPADEPPVTDPCGCREDTKTGLRCIMLERPCFIME